MQSPSMKLHPVILMILYNRTERQNAQFPHQDARREWGDDVSPLSYWSGVESAEADLKSSEVSVKGVFEAQKLVEHIYNRTGKHAVIMKQDPPPEKKEEDAKAEEGKKADPEGGGNQKEEPDQEGSKENGNKESNEDKAEDQAAVEENNAKLEVPMKINELYYHPAFYPPYYERDLYSPSSPSSSSYQYYHPSAGHPPDYFSDENSNACAVM